MKLTDFLFKISGDGWERTRYLWNNSLERYYYRVRFQPLVQIFM